jgi:hypothetical protein
MCVVNARDRTPFDVYIGRTNPRYRPAASKWANPFKIERDGTRAEVIVKYRATCSVDPTSSPHCPNYVARLLACPEGVRGTPLNDRPTGCRSPVPSRC